MQQFRPVRTQRESRAAGFALIELLVVVSIIAVLMGILLPALSAARAAAKAALDLSNLRQVGIGLTVYTDDQDGFYPKHSSSSSGPWPGFDNRPRWPDYIFPYVNDTKIFLNPLLSPRELEDNFQKPFAHDTNIGYGGYGYNFQYLGNSRFNPTFHARNSADVTRPTETVVVGDTAGSRHGDALANPGDGAAAVYVLDPPLASARRAHPDGRRYYSGGNADETGGTPQTYLWRSFPAERGGYAPSFSFADGHAESMTIERVDDHDGDGTQDNGFWNGKGDASFR